MMVLIATPFGHVLADNLFVLSLEETCSYESQVLKENL